MKSPIKWLGGKYWLSRKLDRLIGEVRPKTVAEPFCGGLSFSLHYEFDNVIANDMNMPLVNFYRQLQGGLSYIPENYSIDSGFYYQARENLNALISSNSVDCAESARLFFFLNKQCYNGLMRMNLSGRLNMPHGSLYKKVHEPVGFDLFKEVASDWQFNQGCFSLLDVSQADLMFIDPPYEKTFTNYSGKGFDSTKQIELLDWIVDNNKPTIYCNSAVNSLAKACKSRGFQVYKVLAPRSISCKADGRKPVEELIAFRGFGDNRKFSKIVDGVTRWDIR
jgi:DNA adenine methylase